MPKKIPSTLLLLFSLIALAACDFGDLRLLAQFNELDGLESGDRIIHRGEYIGDVEEIAESRRGRYLVELDIDKDHKDQLTVYSIFYIDRDPDRPGRQAVFTEQKQPGGILLTDDSVVAGLDHPPRLRNMLDDLRRKAGELSEGLADRIERAGDSYGEKSAELAAELENSLAEIRRKLEELEKAVRTAPDSKEARQLKSSLAQLVSDLDTALDRVGTVISRDLYNSVKDTLAELRKNLEELNGDTGPAPPAEEIEEEVLDI